MQLPRQLTRYLPILDWARTYDRETASADGLAAVIVTIMLIPQSLAYALLAGLPAEMGLYASILPLVAYAIFGTSRALAVGPVAVVSLMTAAAIGNLGLSDPVDIALAAGTLAFISGVILSLLGLFRLGFLANFLSHPVIAGFITASGVLIAASQLKHIFGIDMHGHTLTELIRTMFAHLGETNGYTLVLGLTALAFLFWVRKGLKPLLLKKGVPPKLADVLTKAGPVAAVVVTTLATWVFGLSNAGVKIVGEIPMGLPPLTAPSFSPSLWNELFMSALLISIIGFVESVSVAQTLAAKRRQRISPDQELIGLGTSNIASAVSGGFPVTGGFSRSVVNFDAGAATPAAGAYTAVGIAVATLLLTPLLFFLPKATLAATIIVAVLSLVDFSILKKAWGYSKVDFAAVFATIVLTLGFGVELGVSAGVLISIGLHLYKTSRPHVAEVGLVPETHHFRNIKRHKVETLPHLVTLRVDESLYFANARFLEDYVLGRVTCDEPIEHVVLMFPAVNEVDMSALETLEELNRRLSEMGIQLHLSEVKGPVMDRLKRSHFLDELTGKVFLSQYDAWQALQEPAPSPEQGSPAKVGAA
ncbi:SulP family inorganic anion transporter [Mameliella alba]|uniref:SulP family inorganic anion transporter n=1 Tax=Mameliella alba TaxID=561184 RepID=UPI000B534AE0|nr:sulfate permease [Mameliella alba]MBY6121377.1 sulfate permease [Mameliella alba]OWV41748.1 sodium-independent anion transporter [Mameliella alba]OWV60514.1 sodium-independent anion transporter [Mameliella alba]BBU58866.1 sodium-independent anion transporter [Mameliella alba]